MLACISADELIITAIIAGTIAIVLLINVIGYGIIRRS